MKIKDNLEVSTAEFWYDINNGYINPDEILVNQKDIDKVNEAVRVLKEFEESCEEQIEGFMR